MFVFPSSVPRTWACCCPRCAPKPDPTPYPTPTPQEKYLDVLLPTLASTLRALGSHQGGRQLDPDLRRRLASLGRQGGAAAEPAPPAAGAGVFGLAAAGRKRGRPAKKAGKGAEQPAEGPEAPAAGAGTDTEGVPCRRRAAAAAAQHAVTPTRSMPCLPRAHATVSIKTGGRQACPWPYLTMNAHHDPPCPTLVGA